MLLAIAKDPNASEDIQTMAKEVLMRVQRSPADATVLQTLEKAEKKEQTGEQSSINSLIKSINGDLDNFLAMYEDESDTEENANPVDEATKLDQVESLVPEFVCALCKCGPSKEENMYPCLICHMDDNTALRGRRRWQ